MKNNNPSIQSNPKTNNQNTNPAQPCPPASNPEPETQNSEPSASRPRVGKIARLPSAVRDDLNDLIDQGYGGEELLQWLNGLKETQELLREHFDGKPISKQNLSDWRRGGYAEWRMQRDLVDDVHSLAGHAIDLQAASNRFIADDLVEVFTARYASLVMRWNGEPSEEFDSQVRLFSRMRRDLLRLQESAHEAALNERQWEKFDDEEDKEIKRKLREQTLAPIKAATRRGLFMTIYGEETGKAMADAYEAIDERFGLQKHKSDEDTEEPDQEPSDECDKEAGAEAPAGEGEKPVEKSDEPEVGTAQKSGLSQALGNLAQAIAGGSSCTEKPLKESRSVKPISEIMDQPSLASEELTPL